MTPFDELQRIANESGIEKALDYVEQIVRRGKKYPALFEVMKMRVRHCLGLPILYSDTPEQLSDEQQRQLEDGLVAACREVGTLLMKSGDLQQGWMYLQPVGDQELNLRLLKNIQPDEENIDLLIDTAVAQGAAPAYGYQLLLEHYGTCNGITTFETQSAAFDRPTQREMATVLLDHLYAELLDNIHYTLNDSGSDSSGNEKETPATDAKKYDSISEVMQAHPDLFTHGAHHIDTTHLASLMRIARLMESPKKLLKAYELAVYGSQLAEDFHYAGQPPFEDTYRDHIHYFGALTGKTDADAAVDHFRQKIETVDINQHGPVAIETTVELMHRLGRNEDALRLSMEALLDKHPPMGIAPDPMTIANTEPLRAMLVEYYRDQDDLVSFAAGLLG